MKYTDARPLIRSGDLILLRGKGPGPWLIRLWTASQWAHCGVAWVVGDRVLLLEAEPFKGVRAIPLSKRLGPGAALAKTRPQWGQEAETAALENLGEPYGWVDALRAGFGLRSTSNGFQCAEYAMAVLSAAQVNLCAGLTATPEHLAECFNAQVPLEP